ncbi:Uncharacterised protein [Mycobacterium tuberculosis]|nr:Uncharacterised protein [Mycobacterium tuberculosis]
MLPDGRCREADAILRPALPGQRVRRSVGAGLLEGHVRVESVGEPKVVQHRRDETDFEIRVREVFGDEVVTEVPRPPDVMRQCGVGHVVHQGDGRARGGGVGRCRQHSATLQYG